VRGLKIFYREAAAPESAPSLLLLHGFPSASHQFRRLIDALERRSFVGACFTAAH
jgi:pimeloyl-ACP methyl ester carboxylesterase